MRNYIAFIAIVLLLVGCNNPEKKTDRLAKNFQRKIKIVGYMSILKARLQILVINTFISLYLKFWTVKMKDSKNLITFFSPLK